MFGKKKSSVWIRCQITGFFADFNARLLSLISLLEVLGYICSSSILYLFLWLQEYFYITIDHVFTTMDRESIETLFSINLSIIKSFIQSMFDSLQNKLII